MRWIVLLPLILVGSLVYWSVAIALGGMSFMAASALTTSTEVKVFHVVEDGSNTNVEPDTIGPASIMVHLQADDATEPEDVNDNSGAAGFTQVIDDQQAAPAPGPGLTSY